MEDNEVGISSDYLPMDPKRLLERFHTALNSRDLTNLLRLLQVDFEQTHAGRGEGMVLGLEPVRQEWEDIFTRYPNFRADLLRQAIEGNTIWSEWKMSGKRSGSQGTDFRREGVIIFGVEGGLLAWGRYYMIDLEQH